MLISWLPDFYILTQYRRFVRQFTHRLADDTLLSHAFSGQPHAPADGEYAWWEQALTGHHYTGRPLHREATPSFTAQQIQRWCGLLEASLDEAFGEQAATEAKGHVLNLATMLAHWHLKQQSIATAARPPAALAAA